MFANRRVISILFNFKMDIQDVVEKSEFLGGVCAPAKNCCCITLGRLFMFISIVDLLAATFRLAGGSLILYHDIYQYDASNQRMYILYTIMILSVLGFLLSITSIHAINKVNVDLIKCYSFCKHFQVLTMPFIIFLAFLVQIKEGDTIILLGILNQELEFFLFAIIV